MMKHTNNSTTALDRLLRGATSGMVPVLAAVAGLAIAAPASAQDDDENWEWEPGTGYHEEEWWDPSDWFDDDYDGGGVDYEETGDWWWEDDDDDYADDYYDDEYYDDYYQEYYDDYYDQNRYDNQRMNRTQGQRDDQWWERNEQRDRQRGQQDRQTRLQDDRLRGELDSWQRMNLRGQRDAHTLVRLRMDNGRSAIVNLGPNVELSDLDMEEGDRVSVEGKRGSINGREVLMAQRVRVDDDTVRMDEWDPQQPGQQQARMGDRQGYDRQMRDRQGRDQRQMRDRQMRDRQGYDRQMRDRQGEDRNRRQTMVRGELSDFKKLDLEGQKDAHTIVRLEMENGREAIVNLGPNYDLKDIDLEEGDQIAVRGIRGTIDDRDVVMAQQVLVMETFRMDEWNASRYASRQREDDRRSREDDRRSRDDDRG